MIGLDIKRLKEIDLNESQAWKVYLAALEYIECGYYLVPVVRGGKGLPRKAYNVNYQHASKSKKIIDKWYHPDSGKFRGWNVGIACGRTGGVFVVDVDKHGETNGFTNLNKLEEINDPLPSCPTQDTPNGGKHYLFQWQENAACTTNKIAKGIDTRGGEANICKGHIVAWPSITEDGRYSWSTGGDTAEIPPWVMHRMGVIWQPTKYGKGGRGNENLTEDDYEQIVPEAQIKRMLSFVEINDVDYSDWLKVGMAIKSQYPESNGLAIWDSWSSDGTRYKSSECKIRWDGFSIQGSVRAGTLFYYAKEGGWEPDHLIDEIKGNKFDELVARMNEEYAVVSVGGKMKILREKEPEFMTMAHYDLLDRDSFKLLLQNEMMVILDEKDKPKNVSIASIWLSHEHRRTYPNGMGLYPSQAPNGYYNTWNGFSVHPRPGDCSLFRSHIKEVICGGSEIIYAWVLDWIADLIQTPDDPKGCAIVMRGGEGIGKGTFANTIGNLFGPHYRHLIDGSHLTNNFNAHLMDAIVVFADEITWGGNKKTSGKLKGMVTEKFLVGERKGIDALLYRNMIHMLIASNSEWVIPAGQDSRRWLVLDILGIHANDVNYFNSLQDEIDNGGAEAFIYEMQNREITNNLRVAPETEALQDQRERSAQNDTLINWWHMALIAERLDTPDEKEFETNNKSEWPSLVDKATLYIEYEDWCIKRRIRCPNINTFLREVKQKLGMSETRVNIGGKRKRVFKILDINKAKEFMGKKCDITGDDDEEQVED